MGMCHDFLNGEGMLQHIANFLGVKVILTPKCHAKLAGEGIEYLWGQAKGIYRSLSLNQKKGKDKFKAAFNIVCRMKWSQGKESENLVDEHDNI